MFNIKNKIFNNSVISIKANTYLEIRTNIYYRNKT